MGLGVTRGRGGRTAVRVNNDSGLVRHQSSGQGEQNTEEGFKEKEWNRTW